MAMGSHHRICLGGHDLQVLKLDGELRKLAESLKKEQSLLMFGRGYNYATALEAALKVKHSRLYSTHLTFVMQRPLTHTAI